MKVIKIENDIVFLGKQDNTIVKHNLKEFEFAPKVGDTVNIYKDGDKTIITKDMSKTDKFNEKVNNFGTAAKDSFDKINPKKKVGKVTYILLAIFLGGIGIHKFYSGKTILGVIYLIFSFTGIPGIIGLVEAFMAGGMEKDAEGKILI